MIPEIPIQRNSVRPHAEGGSQRRTQLLGMTSSGLHEEMRLVLGNSFDDLADAERRYRTNQQIEVVMDTLSGKFAEQFGRVIITPQKLSRRPLREMQPVATERLIGFLVPIAETIEGKDQSGHYLAVLRDNETENSKLLIVKPHDDTAEDIYSRKGPHLVVHGDDPVDNFAEEYASTGMEVLATTDVDNDRAIIDSAVILALRYIDYGTEMQRQKLRNNHIEDTVTLFARETDEYLADRSSLDLPVIED